MLESMTLLRRNGAVVSMVGAQSVSKFKEAQAAANRVQVYVGLIRYVSSGFVCRCQVRFEI